MRFCQVKFDYTQLAMATRAASSGKAAVLYNNSRVNGNVFSRSKHIGLPRTHAVVEQVFKLVNGLKRKRTSKERTMVR
jgi:hypothetical protein